MGKQQDTRDTQDTAWVHYFGVGEVVQPLLGRFSARVSERKDRIMRTQPEPLPAAVLSILGTGQPGCRRCGGDGVLVVTSLSGPAFRPCACVAKSLPLRASRPTSRRSAAG